MVAEPEGRGSSAHPGSHAARSRAAAHCARRGTCVCSCTSPARSRAVRSTAKHPGRSAAAARMAADELAMLTFLRAENRFTDLQTEGLIDAVLKHYM